MGSFSIFSTIQFLTVKSIFDEYRHAFNDRPVFTGGEKVIKPSINFMGFTNARRDI